MASVSQSSAGVTIDRGRNRITIAMEQRIHTEMTFPLDQVEEHGLNPATLEQGIRLHVAQVQQGTRQVVEEVSRAQQGLPAGAPLMPTDNMEQLTILSFNKETSRYAGTRLRILTPTSTLRRRHELAKPEIPFASIELVVAP